MPARALGASTGPATCATMRPSRVDEERLRDARRRRSAATVAPGSWTIGYVEPVPLANARASPRSPEVDADDDEPCDRRTSRHASLEQRRLVPARVAPGGPEVDHDRLAPAATRARARRRRRGAAARSRARPALTALGLSERTSRRPTRATPAEQRRASAVTQRPSDCRTSLPRTATSQGSRSSDGGARARIGY